MPLVFVHGVNTRKDSQYEDDVKMRDALFEEIVLPRLAPRAEQSDIFNPYWGEHGVTFPWGHGGLPDAEHERFGADDIPADEEATPALLLSQLQVLDEPARIDSVLLYLARRSLDAAIDLLFATAMDRLPDSPRPNELAKLAEVAGAYADAYRDEDLKWLQGLKTDSQFVDCLLEEFDRWRPPPPDDRSVEQFGFGRDARSWLYKSAGRVGRAAHGKARTAFRKKIREPVHSDIAALLGDVFVYLHTRGQAGLPGAILAPVIEHLEQASRIRAETGEPLIVVAHSMGGNIAYDILSHFRPDLKVDYFVTVGSQISLFEEMKLFKHSDDRCPSPTAPRVPKPDFIIRKWLNIFAHSDVLGFTAGKVFEGVEDFAFDNGSWLLAAHRAYFKTSSFYHGLALRIDEGAA